MARLGKYLRQPVGHVLALRVRDFTALVRAANRIAEADSKQKG